MNSRNEFVFTENNDEVLDSQVTTRSAAKCESVRKVSLEEYDGFAFQLWFFRHPPPPQELEVASRERENKQRLQT